ncbi:MAG: 30S ribosomal protein S2, partial [Candidatus Altarchaeaceae archaeon]
AFARYCGFKFIEERFVSGSLTNPNIKHYVEPKIIFVTDPDADRQVINEAAEMNIPVIAICNSNVRYKNIDFVIPGNNRTRYSLAMIFWLLTKEMSKIKGFEFKTECPRPIVDEKGNEVLQDNEFLSQGEPEEYKIRMKQINKFLELKRKLRRRGRKKKKREKKLVYL